MDLSTMMNVTTMQRRRCRANIPINISVTMNVLTTQYRMYYDDYSVNVFNIVTVLMA